MKTRIIVAVIAIPILLAIIFFAPVWALGIVVGVIASCAAYELIRAAKPGIKKHLPVYACLGALIMPIGTALLGPKELEFAVLFLVFAAYFCELMFSFRNGEPMDFEIVLIGILTGAVMPMLLNSLVRLGLRDHGPVYVMLPIIAAFSSDSGAYFAGTFLGKHKMTPHLSPNKTLEGSAGGFLSSIILMLIYALILKALKFGVNIPVMLVYGFLGSLACQLGDLGFSAVKRIYGIKDYGNLIPGHGGMLDRFDSMFWTAAMIEALVSWVPAIV